MALYAGWLVGLGYLFIWPHPTVCRILIPQPEIDPVPPAEEAQSPDHGAAREVPVYAVYLELASKQQMVFGDGKQMAEVLR